MKGQDQIEHVINKGDCYVILPGHSAWSGDNDTVLYEFDTCLDRIIKKHPHSDGIDFDGVLSSTDLPFSIKNFNDCDDVINGVDKMFITQINMFETAIIKKTIGKPQATWFHHIRPCLNEHVNCEHLKSCTERHVGFIKSGKLQITMDNQDEYILNPMDSFVIEPGHDAKVVSDDDVVMYGFSFAL